MWLLYLRHDKHFLLCNLLVDKKEEDKKILTVTKAEVDEK